MNTNIPENLRLSPERIRALLSTEYIGKNLFFFDSVTSTFDIAKNLDLSHGDVICAKTQTGGVGRMGRKWNSDEGGIYFSLILRPEASFENFQFLTAVCALGVQKALCHYTLCKIKWPNDIISSSGKKLCGILTKGYFEGNGVPVFNVGIGINVNNTDFNPSLKFAGSLKSECNHWIDENEVLSQVLLEIESLTTEKNTQKLIDEYSKVSVTLGKTVKIIYPDTGEELTGKALKIDSDGSLWVDSAKFGEICVNSGEVSVRGIYDESYV